MTKISPLILTASIFLISCAQTIALPTLPVHTIFDNQTEKAVIYLYRDEDFGGSLPLKISMNDIAVGKTTGRTFFRLEVKPSVYRFATELGEKDTLLIEVESGKNYFIRQEVKIGMFRPNATLEVVEPGKGQEGVRSSNRLESINKH